MRYFIYKLYRYMYLVLGKLLLFFLLVYFGLCLSKYKYVMAITSLRMTNSILSKLVKYKI